MVSTRSSDRQTRSNGSSSAKPPTTKGSKPAPKTKPKKRSAAAPEPGEEPAEKQTKLTTSKNGASNASISLEHPHNSEEPQESKPAIDAEPTAVVSDSAREQRTADSSILEKGMVYFFVRGKVNIENPSSLAEVKRSYMVLRPLSSSSKLSDGVVQNAGHNRLIAIPKKRLPVKGGKERFLTFVEEPRASVEELRERYLLGKTYMTKTQGERTDYPAEPVAEGVYAITKSEDERQGHFAYMLTLPEEPTELQEEFGLKEKGSFVVSVRNPSTPAPPNAGIPQPAEYPKEIMDDFRGLRWTTLEPKHLEYKHAEVLFIGERNFPSDGEHKETEEELQELEEEDKERVQHLNGTDAVFLDLELSKKAHSGGFS